MRGVSWHELRMWPADQLVVALGACRGTRELALESIFGVGWEGNHWRVCLEVRGSRGQWSSDNMRKVRKYLKSFWGRIIGRLSEVRLKVKVGVNSGRRGEEIFESVRGLLRLSRKCCSDGV
eukprot:144936-Hanusia_phi.AAC.4